MSGEKGNKKLIFWIVVAAAIAVLPWIVLASGITD
jgi:hypothetical protein